ncbi:hypothetical protein K8R20_02555 [bacterium]|nr:hypothetical protein [bacterium]
MEIKDKNDIFVKMLLIMITISLLFISYSLYTTNKTLKTTQDSISDFETDIRSIKLDVAVLKDETGWERIFTPENKKKEALLNCMKSATDGNPQTDSYTAMVLTCIGIYLSN